LDLPGWARTEAQRQQGLQLLEEANQIAAALNDPDLLARAEALAGTVQRDEGRLKQAIDRARSPTVQAEVADWYHNYLGTVGRYDDALVVARRAIRLYGAAGARLNEALAVNYGGRCWAARAGRLTESLDYAARFRGMAAELDDAQLRACRAMEAEPYVYAGRWGDAVRVAEESLPLAWEVEQQGVVLFASAWLGLAYLKLGRRDEARQVIARALKWGESRFGGTAFARTYLTIARALSHLADGEADAALQRARRAIELAELSGFRLEQGAAHRAVGQVLEANGQRAEAKASYLRSLEIFEGIQSLPELGQTLLALGRFTFADDVAEGRRLVERSRSIFDEIGATGWSREAAAALKPV
jgi:tetratricopeptide (TPR) repeat protein